MKGRWRTANSEHAETEQVAGSPAGKMALNAMVPGAGNVLGVAAKHRKVALNAVVPGAGTVLGVAAKHRNARNTCVGGEQPQGME
uniref:DUF4235 domain-containing protein n=1 Tax=Globodera pallida TaxID=36090 RepID=A0A183BLS6_GLOPA